MLKLLFLCKQLYQFQHLASELCRLLTFASGKSCYIVDGTHGKRYPMEVSHATSLLHWACSCPAFFTLI